MNQARQLTALVSPRLSAARNKTVLQSPINLFNSTVDLTNKNECSQFFEFDDNLNKNQKPSNLLANKNTLLKNFPNNLSSIHTNESTLRINSSPEKRKFLSAFSAPPSKPQNLCFEFLKQNETKSSMANEEFKKKVLSKNIKSFSIGSNEFALRLLKKEKPKVRKHKNSLSLDNKKPENAQNIDDNDLNKQYLCHFCDKDFRRPDILSRFINKSIR